MKNSIGPRISESAKDFFEALFASGNQGYQYALESFPALYQFTLDRELKGVFTDGELKLMLDVFNGTALTPQISGQHLLANVVDGIELDGLNSKWGVDKGKVIEKIKGLSLFQCACMELWANGFWYGGASPVGRGDGDVIEGYVGRLV
jgi:hypothetical protein